MKPEQLQQWKKPLLLAFCAGVCVIGPLDFYHAWLGVERYFIRHFTVTEVKWPVFLPLQMGLAGAAALVLWALFRMYVVDEFLGEERESRVNDRVTAIICVVMVAGAYLASAALMGDTVRQTGFFFTLYTASLLFVLLTMSGQHAAAFVVVAFAGTIIETLLLAPAVGYYEFEHRELFGRVPAWLPLAYGWAGIFLHRISWKIQR
ncbi:MAG: hypothetical protein JW807_17210 [Spirochaetes bacterium]|nr:hypothetical protein [Spirochaetota bacterium]